MTQDDIEEFKKRGFIKLKNFFKKELIQYIKETLEQQIEIPEDKYTKVFNKLKYDSLNNDKIILKSVINNNIFQKTLLSLINKNLFFTQTIGLELSTEKKGFPWHVGTQSFSFQKLHDYGCTIWTPLIPITKTQEGGMSYISKEFLSGEFMYQYINLVAPFLKEKMKKGEEVDFETFNKYKDGLLNTFPLIDILEDYKTSDYFELGDALLFDKYVIHKSNPLLPGKYNKRLAFVMRFIEIDSTYDKNRADIQELPREIFKYKGASCFHKNICSKENEKIINSDYFTNINERIIKSD